MNPPTVDVEQGNENFRPDVAQLKAVVRSLRGNEERVRMIILDERARACGPTLKAESAPGEETTAVVPIPDGRCL
jgi:hypothetical protein